MRISITLIALVWLTVTLLKDYPKALASLRCMFPDGNPDKHRCIAFVLLFAFWLVFAMAIINIAYGLPKSLFAS